MSTITPLAPAPPVADALAAYDELAAVYDAFTSGHDYERFLSVIEALARDHGLAGRRVLDVACGTGKSFMPLVRRGYDVTACDLSPGMAALAHAKSGGRARVLVADMRELPPLGEFDLLTCLDDSLNYLLTDDDLAAAFEGFERLLAPRGLAVFDVNTLRTYRTAFAHTFATELEGIFFCWRGEASAEFEPGDHAQATLEAFRTVQPERWARLQSHHVQRHHPREELTRICEEAGLEVLTVFGQNPGVRLDPNPNEYADTKLLYVVRKPDQLSDQ